MKFKDEQEKRIIKNIFSLATWNNINSKDAEFILIAKNIIETAAIETDNVTPNVVEFPEVKNGSKPTQSEQERK